MLRNVRKLKDIFLPFLEYKNKQRGMGKWMILNDRDREEYREKGKGFSLQYCLCMDNYCMLCVFLIMNEKLCGLNLHRGRKIPI